MHECMNMLQNIFAHLNLNQYVCAAIWRLAFRSGRILVWCSSGDQEEEEEEEATAKKTGRENVLQILICKCASRHNGVQFFISHLASWLRTRCFSEPTFRPSGAPNHWKNAVFRDFRTFSRICIFFLLTLSLLLFFLLIFLFSLPLPCSAFHLSILSEV